jgi:hypothetical protein
LAMLRRRAKRQLSDCVAQQQDAAAAEAACRARKLTTQLGFGASREPVPNGRAVRVALQAAKIEPSYFHADVCSHCNWSSDLARCANCHAKLCSWHRLLAYKAGRDTRGRALSADGCVCQLTDACTARSREFADAIRRLDSA